jgi:hypothetical protein
MAHMQIKSEIFAPHYSKNGNIINHIRLVKTALQFNIIPKASKYSYLRNNNLSHKYATLGGSMDKIC